MTLGAQPSNEPMICPRVFESAEIDSNFIHRFKPDAVTVYLCMCMCVYMRVCVCVTLCV